MIFSIDALLTGRDSTTAIADYRRRLTPTDDVLSWTCEEDQRGHAVVADMDPGDSPLALSMGTVAKGRLLVLLADAAIAVYINGASTDPIQARFLVLESDSTTGITSVHVKNETGASVALEYLIAGDIAVTT